MQMIPKPQDGVELDPKGPDRIEHMRAQLRDRIEHMRAQLREICDEAPHLLDEPGLKPRRTSGRLTVPQLAEAIGQTEGSTRRLLAAGLIPGARRVNPRSPRSPWLIPAESPERYLAGFEGGPS